jgi:redox-sensing transcriptional repressor
MSNPQQHIPDRVIERLSAYRRHLRQFLAGGRDRVFSHDLALPEGVTAAQVRRDIMTIGYSGSPAKGYDVAGLIQHISRLLDPPEQQAVALVGVGHLGRALLDYFAALHPEHEIVAAFDINPAKVGRVVHGCHCHALAVLPDILRENPVSVGVIAVPGAAAQDVADRLVEAGVSGLLNFAPVRLRVPADVFVEDVDISLSLEKAAFFARERRARQEAAS